MNGAKIYRMKSLVMSVTLLGYVIFQQSLYANDAMDTAVIDDELRTLQQQIAQLETQQSCRHPLLKSQFLALHNLDD